MSRLVTLWLTLSLLLPIVAFAQSRGRARRRPNVIFMLADDLGWGDLGSYGQTKIRTPHLDRLAAEGMRFTQFYAGSPVCAPSRAVLMTGKHGGHASIRDNREVQPEGQMPIPAAEVTMAERLKSQGYATGAFGKWGLGFVGTEGDPNQQGFDRFFGYNCQREAHNFYPDHLWRNSERVMLAGNTRGLTGKHYSHDLIEAEALQFVRDHQHQPFFLYLPFTIPHLALQVPDDSLAEYAGQWDDPAYDGQQGYLPHPRPRAAYAAMVTRMDRSVGRLLALVKELGLDDHTVVMFSSDNGGAFGEVTQDFEFKPGRMGGTDYVFFGSTGKFRAFKGSVYEGGIRVPFIARWPGKIKAGTVSELPAVFYDVLPTLCEVAGLEPPQSADGLSLLPTLLGRGRQTRHEFLFWDFNGYGGQQAVRLADWKGVRRNLQRGKTKIELYNLANDVGEQHDVADQHPAIVRRIQAIMEREHTRSEVFPMKFLDDPPPPKERPNVVFLLADDLGYMDLGANHPKTFYATPNLDALARSGMRFTCGYAAAPVCSPTRASIMTGKYPVRTGITDFIGAEQPWPRNTKLLPAPYRTNLPLAEVTLAERLRAAGYATFMSGKWHLGDGEANPNAQGFAGLKRRGSAQFYYPATVTRFDDVNDPKTTDVIADETVKFMAANKDKPFFAYVPFLAVHTAIKARPDLVEKWKEKAKSAPAPAWGKEYARQVRLVQNHAEYAAMLEQMDVAIGRILAALAEHGIADHTIVVFTSDNGGLSTSEGHPTSNEPWRAGKGWPYEGGVRVPVIIRAPGVTKAGSVNDTPVISTDYYATMLDLTGLPPSPEQHRDSRSLKPLLKGGKLKARPLFWHYPHYGNQGGAPMSALREGNWKLIEWFEDGKLELFNLAHDPYEKNDVAAKEPARVKALHAKLKAWRAETGAQLPTRNPNFNPQAQEAR
jgi:arylsulfatase